MKWWFLLILVEAALLFLCEAVRSGKSDTLKRAKAMKLHVLLAILACAGLVLFVGLRYRFIGDSTLYVNEFKKMSYTSFKDAWGLLSWDDDAGFYFISALIKMWVTDNITAWLVIIALITVTPLFICFYKHSGATDYAVMIYIFIGGLLMDCTAMKQMVAVNWMFLMFPLIYKKKWYLYLPLVYLMSQFHKSALIFIPIYFLLQIRSENIVKRLPIIIVAIGFVLAVTYPVTGPALASFMGEANSEAASTSGGASPIRIIIALIPLVFGMIFRERIKDKEPYYDIVLALSAFTAIWYTLAVFYWVYARFALYFVPFSILLICWLVKYGFTDKQRAFWYFIILACYFAYFVYDMSSAGYSWSYRWWTWQYVYDTTINYV